MKYIKIDINQNNAVLAHSATSFTNLNANEAEVQADFNFPLRQPLHFYRWNDVTQQIEVNDQESIDKFHTKPIYRIYNYLKHMNGFDYHTPPDDINYNILGLHKKRIFNKGELTTVEYYGSYDFATDTYSDIVLHEDRTYYRINEMVYKRELNICWHYNDDSSGSTKQTTKFYTQSESLAAGERRRRNCITNLKINAIGLIMEVSGVTQLEAEEIGWAFLGEFTLEINSYIEGAQQYLLDALMATTNHPWLDGTPAMLGGATVRQYLYSELWIDYTENNTYV